MAIVRCSVNGCSTRLQPLLKPDPGDRESWVYPECDVCFRPACEKHLTELDGQIVCDRCRSEQAAERPPIDLIDLDLGRLLNPK